MTDPISHPETEQVDPMAPEQLRQELDQFTDNQKTQFLAHTPVTNLVEARSRYIDHLLERLWQHFGLAEHPTLALIAVGGYGRGELHPLSDVDILVLSQTPIDDSTGNSVSAFLTLLWDLKLDVGHSVRTIDECINIGQDDLTVATNLQESRWLCGNQETFQQLEERLNDGSFWPSEAVLPSQAG